MITAGLRKLLAVGSGAGFEITGPRGSESLRISAVRVRPSGARVLGGFTIEDFQRQPAAAWGADYAAFLGKLGLRHVAATVVLPRHEVIVRQLALPGISGKDLAGAVRFQMDSLHPYSEEDVLSSWTRLQDSSTVLVAIVRAEIIQRYATLFAEAGMKIAGFTCSAAVTYSALRMFGGKPPAEVLAYETVGNTVEIYGESPSKPLFSAAFELDPDRAMALAAAELRFEAAPVAQELRELLNVDPPLPFAAALSSACPRHCLPLNLLPAEQRQTSSPMIWVPTTALAVLVLLAAGATTALPGFENRRYLGDLAKEIAKVQPGVTQAAAVDREIELTRKRTILLDSFRARSKADMDVLAEMTKLLAPPVWLSSLELNAQQVAVTGEADQAAPLLKTIDASPQFQSSEFVSPPVRSTTGELFRIRTTREAGRQGLLP
ncbi:MAG TPA: PilN domain-containing protein [Bryobacteraceae bacterium]|nr:PilN domain-containing protein [Bryobacteraceae bacterium]